MIQSIPAQGGASVVPSPPPTPQTHTHTHITNCQSFSAACVRLEGIAGQICWSALLPKQLFSLIIHSLLIQSYECALFVYITSMKF